MKINRLRIEKAQELMRDEGMIGIMVMNRDDYRYFFGDIRVQPRAILPAFGDPIFICFKAEEEEIRKALGEQQVKVFGHVGQQMASVSKTFKSLAKDYSDQLNLSEEQAPKVGMQLWFQTPAFLVDLFRKLNPEVELVHSDPVMDELRMVKDPEEIDLIRQAQETAVLGMDRVRELLAPGVSGQELAAEALYVMMKAGASGTSTPIHINAGIRSCWIHGNVDETPIERGDLVVVNLTPQYRGYCGNLARTYVIGEPEEKQQLLINTYQEIINATRDMLKPDVSVGRLDRIGLGISEEKGLGEHHLNGISHGIGLRFEETPASTILPHHRQVKFRENMTATIGHTILAIPGYGGVRFEDVYLVTPEGGRILVEYPIDPIIS